MKDTVLDLFAERRGHFRFESGHHGDLWLDIPPAYVDPGRLRPHAVKLAKLLTPHRIEAICGPLVEGALIAQMVAEEMGAEFYFAEQFARPAGQGLYPIGYRLPLALRGQIRGKRMAILDDVINAGSAVRGACEDLLACGAVIAAVAALLVLGTPAVEFASSVSAPLVTLSELPTNALWAPSNCPLCASGMKLEGLI